MPSQLAFADPSRVLYGSDYPFAPAAAVWLMRKAYEEHHLDRRTREAIDRGNAEALFPRLAA